MPVVPPGSDGLPTGTGKTGQAGQLPGPVPTVPPVRPTKPPRKPVKPVGPIPDNLPVETYIPQPSIVHRVYLIRPARQGVVELTAPFTAQKILNGVQELYGPLGHDWTLRIFPTEAAWKSNQFYTVDANVQSNTVEARHFVGQFQDKLEQNGNVYIYKELVSYSSIWR